MFVSKYIFQGYENEEQAIFVLSKSCFNVTNTVVQRLVRWRGTSM